MPADLEARLIEVIKAAPAYNGPTVSELATMFDVDVFAMMGVLDSLRARGLVIAQLESGWIDAEVNHSDMRIRPGDGRMAWEKTVPEVTVESASGMAAPPDELRLDQLSRMRAHDDRVRDAVQLVIATTSKAVTLRAIRQVQAGIDVWSDYGGERRMFTNFLRDGLDLLANFIEAEEPSARQRSVLDALRVNVDQAIKWANDNDYARFAVNLMEVSAFISAVARLD